MRKLLLIVVLFLTTHTKGQDFLSPLQAEALLKIKNDTQAQKFEPYLVAHHGVGFDIDSFKTNNKIEYYKELWYYSKSFYVKRNFYPTGITLDETIFDVFRFEDKRSESEEVIITLDAFKDVIILLPRNQGLFTND